VSWLDSIMKILERLLKAAPAFLAYLAGKGAKQREIEKAETKALEKELEQEHEEDAILSDPDKLERMRDRWKDHE
jgi:hypothetical protein